jgi:DNA helicase-2/ATP-dependent DNA helicase PcrA
VADLQTEITQVCQDYVILSQVVEQNSWDLSDPYQPAVMKARLSDAPSLSIRAKNLLVSRFFEKIAQQRLDDGQPFSLKYILNRATSVDWNVLDIFYRLCGFGHFKRIFDLVEKDEGPVCNLSLISQYLARFMDEYGAMITAELLTDDRFQRLFIFSYLYALYRLGEAEYEDAEDPFPRGRIPFLTIHQSKGLEFPVVVLGNPRKTARAQRIEEIVQPLLNRQGEPIEQSPKFDVMRMFYVALSRAKNLLILAHFSSQGNYVNEPFKTMLKNDVPRIPDFEVSSLPAAVLEESDLAKNYSYTADYLSYQKCPRQYMIFRKYGFVPTRSQTMFFGSLVHQTLEDLHQFLIARREQL